MAGDWIKMRVNLDRDPKVTTMAEFLAENKYFCAWLGLPAKCDFDHAFDHVPVTVTRDVVIASLLRVWGVALERGKRDGDDLVVTHCSLFTLDEVAGVPGFGEALESVGWVSCREDSSKRTDSVFPNFLLDNVPAEERIVDRRRELSRQSSQRYREKVKSRDHDGDTSRDNDVTMTGDAKVTLREEENREENKDTKIPPPPCPDPPFSSAAFAEAWELFAAHRKQKRDTLTPSTIGILYKKFAKLGEERTIAGLLHTVEKGWTGFREPDYPTGPKKPVSGSMEANHAEATEAKERFKAQEAEVAKQQGEIFTS